MWKHVTLTKLDESKLGVVRVGRVVLETVVGSAHQSKCFVQSILIPTPVVLSTKLYASSVQIPDQTGRSGNANVLCRNVVFQAGALVDGKLAPFVNRAT